MTGLRVLHLSHFGADHTFCGKENEGFGIYGSVGVEHEEFMDFLNTIEEETMDGLEQYRHSWCPVCHKRLVRYIEVYHSD